MGHPLHLYHKGRNECDDAINYGSEKLCSVCHKSTEPKPGFRCLPCNFALCLSCSAGFVHPAHVGHALYFTKITDEPWNCGACSKTWEQIGKRAHYTCGECDFNLCEACFQPIKLPLHNHYLNRTDVRYTYQLADNSSWQCDSCGGNNGPENFFPRHCSACQFDACDECCKAWRSPLHEHLLYKADSMIIYSHYYGGWRCDHCSSRFRPDQSPNPYHCPECSYDLCAQCIRNPEDAAARVSGTSTASNRGTGGSLRQRIIMRTDAGHPVTTPVDDDNQESISPTALDTELCVICLTNEKNATFIHGDTGHVCCCYDCARELQQRNAQCPICRAPIERVIKQYSV